MKLVRFFLISNPVLVTCNNECHSFILYMWGFRTVKQASEVSLFSVGPFNDSFTVVGCLE